MAYERHKLELPDRLSMTTVEMACWNIIGKIRAKEGVLEDDIVKVIEMIQEKQKHLSNWRELMFAVANNID
jgi:hypothetical protein